MARPQRRYLRRWQTAPTRPIRAHQPIGQAMQEVAPRRKDRWLLLDAYSSVRNIAAAYAELEWKS